MAPGDRTTRLPNYKPGPAGFLQADFSNIRIGPTFATAHPCQSNLHISDPERVEPEIPPVNQLFNILSPSIGCPRRDTPTSDSTRLNRLTLRHQGGKY